MSLGKYVKLSQTECSSILTEVTKGVWGMPRLLAAKKDVLSCEKLRGVAQKL